MESLLGHVALRFVSRSEDLATESLGYILRRSPPARAGLRQFLSERGIAVSDALRYENQVGGDDDARPDLVGVQGGDQPLVVEAKFWAELTNNQPVTYLRRLPFEAPGALLVVAPAARLGGLWVDLRRRCEDARMGFDVSTTQPFVARVNAHHRIALTSWRDLLGALRSHVGAAHDHAAATDLEQLAGLCDRVDTDAFVPVTDAELSTGHYRRVAQFGHVIDAVVERLAKEKAISTQGARASAGNGWYGRYFSVAGFGLLLVCDTRRWGSVAPTPLWLRAFGPKWRSSDPDAARRAVDLLPTDGLYPVLNDADGFPTFGIKLRAGLERAGVEAVVVARLREAREAISVTRRRCEAAAVPPPDDGHEAS